MYKTTFDNIKPMNIYKIYLALIFIITVCSPELFSQLKQDAQLRSRMEYRDGYKALAEKDQVPAVFISQRTRLNMLYESEKLKTKLSLQDVRVWGDEQLESSTGVYGDYSSMDLHEAWVEWLITESVSFKVGRQSLSYSNQRLLAARNWNQNGLSYDMAMFQWNTRASKIHAGFSWNSMKESSADNLYPEDRYKTLSFIWINRKINDNLSLSTLDLLSGRTATDTSNTLYLRNTFGGILEADYNLFKVETEAYYQHGENTSKKLVNACLLSVSITLELPVLKPTVGYTYASGNKQAGTNTLKRDKLFDLHYGSRHRFFGYMDYFSNLQKSTNGGGLQDLYLSLESSVNKLKMGISYHNFKLAHPVYNMETSLAESIPRSQSLADELDVRCQIRIYDNIQVELGYNLLFPKKTLQTIQDKNDCSMQQFGYLMLDFQPSF